MRVGQRPHQAAGFIGDLEIGLDLESVERFQSQSCREKYQQRPPAKLEVGVG